MDFINKFTSGNNANQPQDPAQATQNTQASGSSGFMDKLHGMAGGGPESEKKEDALDKGTYLRCVHDIHPPRVHASNYVIPSMSTS